MRATWSWLPCGLHARRAPPRGGAGARGRAARPRSPRAARSWWKLNTSASASTISPASTAVRRSSISSASSSAVTAASRSNATRRPSTDIAETTARTSGSRPSTWRRTSLGHGPRQGSAGQVLGAHVAGAGDELLEEERVAAGAAVEGLDGAVRRVLLEHGGEELAHLGGAEPAELHVGDEVAALEAGEQVGGGVAPGEPVGSVGADEHERAAVGFGEPLEDGEALGVGPVEVLEHDERRARPPTGSGRGRRRLAPAPRRRGSGPSRRRRSRGCALTSVLPRASRNSSIGRPTVPGSAWPASTSVPGGALATSSCTRRVLPMPASPAIRAIGGRRRRAEERAQPSEVGLPADHHGRQTCTSHEHGVDRTVLSGRRQRLSERARRPGGAWGWCPRPGGPGGCGG